jgi:membrane protein implicated in regulation of membrane protease activity
MEAFLHGVIDVGPFHWLALAALLIAIEMVMPTQYLMWPALAAAFVGLIGFVVDISVVGEVTVFSVLAVGLTVVSHRLFPPEKGDAAQGLNQRMDQLVGQTAIVATDFQGGSGGVMLGDTRWAARSVDGSDLREGTRVSVAYAESTLLVVRPVSAPTQ